MKIQTTAAAALLGAAAGAFQAQAGDAVQWRVEDGGNGHWYQSISAAGKSWLSCSQESSSSGGHLATISNTAENDFVRSLTSNVAYWIGAKRDGNPCSSNAGWCWVTNESFEFSSWAASQPDCWASGQLYVAVNNISYLPGWHDYDDTTTIPIAIIEWDADCNSDSIVDYGQCHDGTLPDYNGNNIPDCCEQGVPCTVGNYPVQWRVEDGGNGHWYLATRPIVPLNWQGSIDACTATRGHLPTLASQAENNFVMALALGTWLATDTPTSGPFIGGRRSSSQQTSACAGWQWITNEPFNYVAEFPTGDSKGYGPCGSVCQCMNNFYQDEQVLAYWDRRFPVWNSCQETNISAVLLVEWDADCNNDNIVDYGQILNGTLPDTNGNNIPDCCEPGNSCCLGDIYENHIVDGGDLGVLLSEWGVVTPTTRSDLNRDGFVDGADLGRLLANWGPCGG